MAIFSVKVFICKFQMKDADERIRHHVKKEKGIPFFFGNCRAK